jgi:hypothetical protein
VHRPDRGVVLIAHRGEAAAALLEVAADAAHQPDVGVGVDEDLDVELIADRGLDEDQDALDQNQRRRLDVAGLGPAGVGDEVVDRHVDRVAGLELGQVLGEERAVEGRRMVVVDLGAGGRRQVALVLVVRVMIDDRAATGRDRGGQLGGDRRLAGAGAAGDADRERARRHRRGSRTNAGPVPPVAVPATITAAPPRAGRRPPA